MRAVASADGRGAVYIGRLRALMSSSVRCRYVTRDSAARSCARAACSSLPGSSMREVCLSAQRAAPILR